MGDGVVHLFTPKVKNDQNQNWVTATITTELDEQKFQFELLRGHDYYHYHDYYDYYDYYYDQNRDYDYFSVWTAAWSDDMAWSWDPGQDLFKN